MTIEKKRTNYFFENSFCLTTNIAGQDTLHVIVKSVDYNNHTWAYWGFTNDSVQQELVHDLNSYYHKKNIRFITEEEARSKNIKADRVIEVSFSDIEIGQLKELHSTDQRTGKIIVGYGDANQERPVYQTVSATISSVMDYVDNNAILQYRIYDPEKDMNSIFDHFEEKYQWSNTTAAYTGNATVVSDNDWTVINNSFKDVPPKNELAQKLIRNCYNTLISKILNKAKL